MWPLARTYSNRAQPSNPGRTSPPASILVSIPAVQSLEINEFDVRAARRLPSDFRAHVRAK